MLHPLDINTQCPGCGHTMPRFRREEHSALETTVCSTQGCRYYNIHFKMPAIELEITADGKELLEERRIINKEW